MKKILAMYKRTASLERILHIILLSALVAYLIDLTLNNPDLRNHVIYWAQVVSGNWPGEPTNGLDKFKGEFLISLMVAVTINLATLAALVAGFVKLTRLEGSMNTRDMVVWHTILLKQTLENTFTDMLGSDHRNTVKEAVNKSFEMAHDELLDYASVITKNDDGRHIFEKQINELKL